jgi:hypothetical protein
MAFAIALGSQLAHVVGQVVVVYDPLISVPVTATPVLGPAQTSEREEHYKAFKPVYATEEREEHYTVRRPVYETAEREESYTVRRPVVETSEREEAYVVQRPVYETAEREERYTVRRPVYETAEREQLSITYQPRTAYRSYYPGCGTWASVPTTTYVPTTVAQRVPVQTVRYVDEQQVRKVPVQVVRFAEGAC